MAVIQKRKTSDGAVRYRALVRVKGLPLASATFDLKSKAETWAKKMEVEMRDRRNLPDLLQATRRTVDELLDAYVEHRKALDGLDRQRAVHVEFWRERLGDYRLAMVTPATIDSQLAALSAGEGPRTRRPASPATRNRYLATLRHAWNYGVNVLEWASSNPCSRATKAKEPQGRVRYLSKEKELPRLLKACRESSEPRLYPLVVLALSTGARQGELLNLKWSDVNKKAGIAVLEETKNGERRSIVLTPPALGALAEMAKLRRVGVDLVFADETGAAEFPEFAWRRARAAAKLQNFRWHDLRHSAASYLAMTGASLVELKDFLGHKTLQMVARYAHLSPEHVKKAAARMADEFLGAALDEVAK